MRTRSLFMHHCDYSFHCALHTATAPVRILMNEYFLGYHCLMFSVSSKLNKLTIQLLLIFRTITER